MANLRLNNVVALSETGGVATFGSHSSTLNYPTGHVITVYNDSDSTPQTGSHTGHTWYDSLLSITFTPASINSKFVIQGQFNQHCASNGSAMKIVRDGATEPNTGSTLIADGDAALLSSNRPRASIAYSYQGFDANQRNPIAYCVYDDPDTASEITYKLQFMSENASYFINRSENFQDNTYSYASVEISTMTIFEIAS